MIDIEIQTNVTKTLAQLDELANKQLPFATALALTRLAQASQGDLRSSLRQYFTIRNDFVSKGIRIQAAKKADWPFPRAEIGSKDQFMSLQALGGTKTSQSGKEIAVPIKARPNRQAATPKSSWPGRLLSRRGTKRAFIGTNQSGGHPGQRAVLMPSEDGSKEMQVMWLLKRSVKVRPRWPLNERVNTLVRQQYDQLFGKALAMAVATAQSKVK